MARTGADAGRKRRPIDCSAMMPQMMRMRFEGWFSGPSCPALTADRGGEGLVVTLLRHRGDADGDDRSGCRREGRAGDDDEDTSDGPRHHGEAASAVDGAPTCRHIDQALRIAGRVVDSAADMKSRISEQLEPVRPDDGLLPRGTAAPCGPAASSAMMAWPAVASAKRQAADASVSGADGRGTDNHDHRRRTIYGPRTPGQQAPRRRDTVQS